MRNPICILLILSGLIFNSTIAHITSKPSEKRVQLKINYPKEYSIFQCTGKTGRIIIEGSCSGIHERVEARFNNGPWTLIKKGSTSESLALETAVVPNSLGSYCSNAILCRG